jgi:7,8-dihydropterin-6-yl-methyl-4-(beta-D-ribofuranosyl)aminobenzene 5'-phosphate synthase
MRSALKGELMRQDKVEIPEVERVTVWVITDNYFDALRPDSKIAKRYQVVPGKSIHAEHGLAYFVETVVNGKTSACMFDFGLDPVGVMNNMKLLNLDLGRVSAFALSHGHFDHWRGAEEILQKNRMRIAKNTPFYTGDETFLRRYFLRSATGETVDIGQLRKDDIEALGLKVKEIINPTQIIPGAYCTGNIERVTDYERVPPNLLVERDGKLEPDDLRGEQALFFNVKNKGLVVLSGCAHAGIVNTVRHARKITGIRKIHAVMGGFHLIHAKPEIIRKTIADIRAMKPDFIAPAHCSGFEAVVAFSKKMREEFNLNTAGTQYTFSA